MSKLPKLKLIMPTGHDKFREIEEVENFFPDWGMRVLVEGQMVNSYEELVELASQDKYKNKEFLEVTLLPIIVGG